MKKLKTLILLICLITPCLFVACGKSNKGTLSTPKIYEIKGGNIVFNSVAEAEYYTVSINEHEISLDAKHSNYVEIIDNKINYDASKIFVVGDSYSVKIKAHAAKKNSSDYSTVYSYKHVGTVKKPTNVQIVGTTLTWDVVENATKYVVKIITPNDKILFDKDKNVLNQIDSTSIAKADLTEYSFHTNQFDFASLLATAGNYKFFVCAVIADETTYIESSYSSYVSYTHSISLQTPTNGKVHRVNDELHLLTAVDSLANSITISCEQVEKTLPITNNSITKINENLLDVNLNKFFEKELLDQNLNFNSIQPLSFRTKSSYSSTEEQVSFYENSSYSNYVIFENSLKLEAPSLAVEFSAENSCYIASWQTEQLDYIGEFKLVVATSIDVKEYKLDSNIDNMMITDDFVAVSIQAIGVGNNISSNFSTFATNPSNTGTLQKLNYSLDGTTVSWNNLNCTYYIVELENQIFVTNTPSFEIPTEIITSKQPVMKITPIKGGCQTATTTINMEYSHQLAAPTIGYSQGFTSSNLYELTFAGVENAIGYYVHVKSKSSSEFFQIDKLYTTTTIDLSRYICSEGEYTDYEVKVQAVADIHSIYADSEMSRAVSVSHIKVLDAPAFYKTNNVDTPVLTQMVGGSLKYTLMFYGVQDAGSYEVLINYNKIIVNSNGADFTGVYKVDISSYLVAANNYEIKIKALPAENAYNIKQSEFNVTTYAVTKQLPMVKNIEVEINEDEKTYTLNFDPVDNAESYQVRIVRENDSSYSETLNITQSTNVYDYVIQGGVYYLYITAIAPKTNSFYANSAESTEYGYIYKLTNLQSPRSIAFNNHSKDQYLMTWIGDDNADYYLVKLTDPNKISHEFTVRNSTNTNISNYMTVQGNYEVAVYSMIDTMSESSKEYASSSKTVKNWSYTYQKEHDFYRHGVYMYGHESSDKYDFAIDSANELKNILWYHYLYEIDNSNHLKILINLKEKEGGEKETLREAILRLADEATAQKLYNFSETEATPGFVINPGYVGEKSYDKVSWNYLISTTTSNNDLFSYLCQKLLIIYPEFNILDSYSLSHETESLTFDLYYKNALNGTKLNLNESVLLEDQSTFSLTAFAQKDYGNLYSYIDLYSRKSPTGVFKIDSRNEMVVTTTEQLLHAVQHNKKPRFVGDCQTAEQVYNNAKLVLSAIVTNSMNDLEKATAIFDWLEYGYDLTYYNINGVTHISGSVEQENIGAYGRYKHYYLEGMFEDITMLNDGTIQIGSKFATSQSYSKAFALLCGIEGIDTVIVNGSYQYYDVNSEEYAVADHAWNKIYIDESVEKNGKKWFAVDLTFSDNRVNFTDLNTGYGMSSHTYFLVTDTFINKNVINLDDYSDENILISSYYQSSRACNTVYNYYQKASFGLTSKQIVKTSFDFGSGNNPSGFSYSKQFYNDKDDYTSYYQQYSKTPDYGEWQAFFLNAIIYADYYAGVNGTDRSVFEFKFNFKDNSILGSNVFDLPELQSVFETARSQYQTKYSLKTDSGSVYSIEDGSSSIIVLTIEKTA